jgi:putative Holliday junction resolvase
VKARTFLGFDFGGKIIGVAVGSSHSRQAQSLTTVRGGRNTLDWDRISRLIREWQPQTLVVGLPLNMDGSDNPMTRAARQFGNRLKDRYNLPVHMVDERLTTQAAKHILYEAGIPGRRHKRRLDPLAARIILQAFLDRDLDGRRDP